MLDRRLAQLLALLLLALLAMSANAHALRAFAKVNGNEVSGYAFFVGGGRPNGAAWEAKMGEEHVADGKTDAEGGYAFTVPDHVSSAIVVSVDTGDGHFVQVNLKPDRFDSSAADATQEPSASNTRAVAESAAPGADRQFDDRDRRLIEEAVERQIGPLLEQIEVMDNRLRLSDIMSGIFLIIGLAGIALWARGLKRRS